MALGGLGSTSVSIPQPPDLRAHVAVGDLATGIAALHAIDPAAAALAQRDAEAGLTPVERGELAAALDASADLPPWRRALDLVVIVPGAMTSFQSGPREGPDGGISPLASALADWTDPS